MTIGFRGSRSQRDDAKQEKQLHMLPHIEIETNVGTLRHLFGPVASSLSVICLVFITVLLLWKLLDRPTDHLPPVSTVTSQSTDQLNDVFKQELTDYKSALARLDTYLGLQVVLVATTILVIIRRSDSLNFLGNSIPLSWLHFFIPIFLIYLWLKQFPAYLNRWDSQQARNEGVFWD